MKILKKLRKLDPDPILSSERMRIYFEDDLIKLGEDACRLSEEQERQALEFWNRYTPLTSAAWISYYYSRTGVFDVRFVPQDIFYAEIDKLLNHPVRAYGVDDKLLSYRIFPKEIQPKPVAVHYGSVFLNADFEVISRGEAFRLCEEEKTVVAKPVTDSCGGTGVEVLRLPEDRGRLARVMSFDYPVLFQSKVEQHPDLAVFHPESVNTVRLLTYLRESGEVVVLSSVLRMGVGDSFVDNHVSGGCSCGISEDGTLHDFGYSNDGYQIKAHPGGVSFASRRVPHYRALADTAKRLHLYLPQFAMLSWDLSVTPDGRPVMIEMNIGKPSIDFMQQNNGPLFGDYTEEVLERVYRLPLIR